MVAKVTKRQRIDFEGAKGEVKARIKEEVGNLLVRETNRFLDSSRSPVEGGQFKTNKKIKKKGKAFASRLFEKGDMRAAIEDKPYRDGVEVGIFDFDEAQKADNHNKNSAAARRTKVPKREFIPKKGQSYKAEIINRIKRVVKRIIRENEE